MVTCRQGDVFWVELARPRGSEPGYRHPYVIIQNDVFNSSRLNTTIGMALTSNLTRAGIPGNVLLKKGEANLPKTSVVNATQLFTIDKSDLSEKIGRLSSARVHEILNGLRLVTEQREM
jgi:mRNA interferase MazF